jgi:tRNA threonylcarbamoyl adenosine modification protein YjeE
MTGAGSVGPPATRVVGTREGMHALGVELASILRPGDLLVLTGPLGAGKTTLTRGIGEGLQVRGPVTSPTFVLARTHPSLIGGVPLVHVDAYRLSSALELDDLDIDFAGSVVVVEWGSGMLDGVADSWLEVVIERPTGADASDASDADATDDEDDRLDADEPRTVTIAGFGPRWAA